MRKLTGKDRSAKACRTKWAQVEKQFEEGYKFVFCINLEVLYCHQKGVKSQWELFPLLAEVFPSVCIWKSTVSFLVPSLPDSRHETLHLPHTFSAVSSASPEARGVFVSSFRSETSRQRHQIHQTLPRQRANRPVHHAGGAAQPGGRAAHSGRQRSAVHKGRSDGRVAHPRIDVGDSGEFRYGDAGRSVDARFR